MAGRVPVSGVSSVCGAGRTALTVVTVDDNTSRVPTVPSSAICSPRSIFEAASVDLITSNAHPISHLLLSPFSPGNPLRSPFSALADPQSHGEATAERAPISPQKVSHRIYNFYFLH
jgi:hypothetical protein